MSEVKNVNVKLKTISDMQSEKMVFYIDAYQRGYRWSKNEVNSLLEDIRDFSQTTFKSYDNSADKFYCLQPIIVTSNRSDAWKVIDGQQRLTTIYLIYIYYFNNLSGRKNRLSLPFELHYRNKEKLERCFNTLLSPDFSDAENEEYTILDEYLDDIDCYYVIEAYKEISRFFSVLLDNPKLQNQPNDMKTVFDNYMKVIWYELTDCKSDDEIRLFTKVNLGKIPLTNSELVKALLLKNEGNELDAYKNDIAIKWDEIESKLLDNSFWSFLANDMDSYSSRRIDFVFDVMAYKINEEILKKISNSDEQYFVEKKYNLNYFSFYVFNNYMKYLVAIGYDNKKKIEEIWDKILEYYRMFVDWYNKRTWYHLIGYIIYNSNKNNIEIIHELSKKYINENHFNEGHKTYFENELRNMAKETFIKSGGKNKFVNFLSDLDYLKNDKVSIKNVLLMYNLAILEIEEKTNARFAFEEFKSENSWDIEHINAVADERPYDDNDTLKNECLIWLENAKELPEIDKIKNKHNQNIIDLINHSISEKTYLSNSNNNSEFIDIYETIINYFNNLENTNGIGNTTLLNSFINRSYKNDVFPIKRKRILEECCSDVYIPLATKKVFLKSYIKSNSLIKWTKDDYDTYVDDIIEKICKYLNIEENSDGK